jgi:TIR domain/Invasion associated locus B (IalB) protein
MPSKVFISYRRDDSAHFAGRVHDRLEREFGRDLLFMDVDSVPLGVNFIKVLREEVAKCDVLLAVIGPNWLNAGDEMGNRRLDNPNDFVRIEIATALHRDIPVVPILLDRATIPTADQLPKDIEELAARNALDVRHASFHSDMDKLIRGLKAPSGQVGTPPPPQLPPEERRENVEAEPEQQRQAEEEERQREAADAAPRAEGARRRQEMDPDWRVEPERPDEARKASRPPWLPWVIGGAVIAVFVGAVLVLMPHPVPRALPPAVAEAPTTAPPAPAPQAPRIAAEAEAKAITIPASPQPTFLDQFGDWGAYTASSGGEKVCFALAKPASSKSNPPNRPRDPAYMLISSIPAKKVRDEVSIIFGYGFKPNADASIEISGAAYAMYTQAGGAWIKNPAEETRLVDAMRRGTDLTVKGTSAKGTASTDVYSLRGLPEALNRVRQECK